MSEIPGGGITNSAKLYYSRRFLETFLLAAGDDVLSYLFLNTAINDEIDDIIKASGIEVGLKLRTRVLMDSVVKKGN